ncbi:class E sortase [Glycomyces artemisiae]|uniref:Sortase A n=1 Tax=Glycomyces artemisiae TaxID=1076443 RepID=A0A2T0URD8_9ACTN|nr:class E sortase [Glycomyces artemisiae]PRY60501.1 sortase A [Glycomyces artemisiae]
MSDQDWSPFASEPPPRPQGPQGAAPGPAPQQPASPPRAPQRQGPQQTPPNGPRQPSPPRASSPAPQAGPPTTPGRASVPGAQPPGERPPGARPSPGPRTPPAEPDHDTTTALRPPKLAKAPLVPEPDGTAILPVIPAEDVPAPPGAESAARKKRTVKRHRGEGGARSTVRGLGEVLISLGAIVLLYAAYEVFGVSGEINNEQDTLSTDLDTMWQAEEEGDEGSPVPELGDAFARMWAPDIRPESWTLVEGTEPADIEYAPGRYLDGAMPGEQGNFTLAGHNVPAIFQKIRDLEPGDKVVIETKDYFYVYEVQEHVVVDETQVDITAPVPGDPGAEPGDEDYWLTLFTCHPLWDNYERYVVYSQLVDTIDRDAEGDLPDAAVDAEA